MGKKIYGDFKNCCDWGPLSTQILANSIKIEILFRNK